MAETRVITFGCRLNHYESQLIQHHANEAKVQDVVVFNTCAVTQEAERQARQAIRKVRKENPNATLIVTGCSAQIDPHRFSKMPEVDRVVGNTVKVTPDLFATQDPVVVHDIQTVRDLTPHLVPHFSERIRAFVQIQNGCNHRCTFCIIPYGRGNNRSVPIAALVTQIRLLLESGVKEIVLTGVDITDYGLDLPGQPTLTNLIRRLLHHLPQLERLRLSSLDPAELNEDFFELIQNDPRLLPHFHISLQAGDDMILKRMKRRHLRHHIIDFCEKIRAVRPDAVFGADIIAGFPTETEAMFENTLDLVRQCDLSLLHVFPYSSRPGTPAARMPQVPRPLIKERAKRLRNLGKNQRQTLYNQFLGKTVTVLIETENKGHSDHFLPIILDTPSSPGHLVRTHVTHTDGKHLFVSKIN